MPGPVTFLGAADFPQCGPMVRMGFIPNVFVGGIPVSCQTHINTPHLFPVGPICPIHAMPIALGSTQVRVSGLGLGRMFDPIAGCTFVAQGNPTVIDHSP